MRIVPEITFFRLNYIAANKDRLVSEWNAWNPNIPFA